MLEKKLQEELKRFRAINKYGKTMIMEQDAPAAPPADPAAPPDPNAAPPAGAPPTDPAAPPAPGGDLGAGAPPPADAAGGSTAPIEPPADQSEEVDITDLVNMNKSIKDDVDKMKTDNSGVVNKMDDLFIKLNDLEAKLGEMNKIVSKIDELGAKIDSVKPKTEVEKLEMRSLDSYPFNQKPQEFFANKQAEMRQTGKNEYVLTKDDVNNFSADDMKTSFNPTAQEDEYSF